MRNTAAGSLRASLHGARSGARLRVYAGASLPAFSRGAHVLKETTLTHAPQRLDSTAVASRRRSLAAPQSCALLRLRATLVFCAAADAGRSVDLQALRRKRAERPAQAPPARPPPARTTPRRKFYGPTQEQLQLNADIEACASWCWTWLRRAGLS